MRQWKDWEDSEFGRVAERLAVCSADKPTREESDLLIASDVVRDYPKLRRDAELLKRQVKIHQAREKFLEAKLEYLEVLHGQEGK